MGVLNIRESFDITSKGRHGWNGFRRLDTPHDVIVGMGRRDDIVVIALLAQVVIGACCAFISDAFEILLVTSITSNVNVSNGERILPVPFLLRQDV